MSSHKVQPFMGEKKFSINPRVAKRSKKQSKQDRISILCTSIYSPDSAGKKRQPKGNEKVDGAKVGTLGQGFMAKKSFCVQKRNSVTIKPVLDFLVACYATLHPALSVGLSVSQSVGRSPFLLFRRFKLFGLTAPSQKPL